MKNAALCIIFVFAFLPSLSSQVCGTTGNSTYRPNVSAPSTQKMWVRVFYHVVRKTDGTEGFTGNLCDVTTLLNSIFNPYNIFFEESGRENINNSDIYELPDSPFPFSTSNPHNDAIDIYFIKSANSGEFSGCANGIPSKAFFIVNSSALTPVIAHEMGHCLGLYHTHRGSPCGADPEDGPNTCSENPNGSNCTTCGDYICDTPASPVLFGAINTTTCAYTGTCQLEGVSYQPGVSTINIMSYGCLREFTPMQVNAMKNVLNGSLSAVKVSFPFATINGASPICISQVFTVSNLRPGYTVSGWSSSNPSVLSINSSGVATKVTDGPAVITATISDGCQTYSAYKTVYSGKPGLLTGTYSYGYYTFPVSNPSTGIGVSGSTPNIYINISQQDPNAIYTWQTISMSGYSSFNANGGKASLYLSGGAYRNVACTAGNTCGNGPTITFYCYNYSSGYGISVAPNPATDEVTVEAVEVLNEKNPQYVAEDEKLLITEDLEKEVVLLLDENGRIAATGRFASGVLKIDTKNLARGVYYLSIGQGEDRVVKTIVVQH